MSKKSKIALVILIGLVIISVSFTAGCIIGLGNGPAQKPDLALINQAWDAIYQNYVEPTKLDSSVLSQGLSKVSSMPSMTLILLTLTRKLINYS